jgi:hypothetical protein
MGAEGCKNYGVRDTAFSIIFKEGWGDKSECEKMRDGNPKIST